MALGNSIRFTLATVVRRSALVALVAAGLMPLAASAAGWWSSSTPAPAAPSNSYGMKQAEPSMTDRFSASVKKGTSAVTDFVNPKTNKHVPMDTAPAKPDAELYVTMARLQERSGHWDKAASEYDKALKLDSKYLPALIGYAHLKDGHGDFDGATKLYQRAIKSHPKEAGLYNDLGLSYQRRGTLKDAEKSLMKAVELRPDRKLYRNNLATVQFELGKPQEALNQLVVANGHAVGHYNLGFLFGRAGQPQQALAEFQQALVHDPGMVEAQDWIAHLTQRYAAQPAPQQQQQQQMVHAPAPVAAVQPPSGYAPQVAPPAAVPVSDPRAVASRNWVPQAPPAQPVQAVQRNAGQGAGQPLANAPVPSQPYAPVAAPATAGVPQRTVQHVARHYPLQIPRRTATGKSAAAMAPMPQ